MRIARPFGRISTRNLFVFVAGLLAAAFSLALLTTSTAHAADAKWEGTQISYEDNLYTRTDNGAANDPRGVPEGANVFYYLDRSIFPWKMHLIYFAEDADVDTAEKATYRTTLFDSSKPESEQYSGTTEPQSITLTPYKDPSEATTSCVHEGVGWIICPATNWLASGMDYLYTALSGFLEVRPAQTNTDNALYRAWSFMRNTANVLFVIGFLIVIYSQVTSFGISNYHIKKMLPRLIAAAILVNVSYWICAIAIDASNILGYSIQDVFMNIREELVGAEGNTWELISWQSITGVILSGGAGVTAASIGIASFAASAGGAIYMLVPILVGVLMTVLVALLIMAARQALITILLVISPLAFVAFLLPNTEKYFEKWRSLGITMLVMFPIFSVIFGGSQLAAALIIQNADSINLIILGLAVQVAPLIVTPLLIRFSGSILGRVAGMINNPNKGAIDRSRKWAEERAGQMKSRQLAKGKGFIANRARGFDRRRRNREGWQKANDALTEANWSDDMPKSRAHDIHQRAMEAADIKSKGDNTAQEAYNQAKRTDSKLRDVELDLRASKVNVDASQATLDSNWEEFQAGDVNSIAVGADAMAKSAMQRRANQIKQATIIASAEKRRGQSAQTIQARNFADTMEANTVLQTHAGGIDPNGAQRSLADALSAQEKIRSQAVDNANAVINFKNLSNDETTKLALGHSQQGIKVTEDVKEAAITKIASSGDTVQIMKLLEGIDLSPGSNVDHRNALVNALAANSNKPKFIGFGKLGEMKAGIPGGFGKAGMDEAILSTITAGKMSADVVATQDRDYLQRVFESIKDNKALYSPEVLANFASEIDKALKHPILGTKIGERKDPLNSILGEIGSYGDGSGSSDDRDQDRRYM